MGSNRPVLNPDEDQDQNAQAALLTRSGDGESVDNEAELLQAMFGDPDADGIYGKEAN